MSEHLKTLREQRGKLAHEMRAITDRASVEKRDMTDEEVAKHGELFAETEKLRKRIEVAERQAEIDRQTAAQDGGGNDREERGGAASARPTASPEYRAAFANYLRGGRDALSSAEVRALSVGVGSQGGFTVAPEQFVSDLIRFVDDMVYIRQRATIIPVANAASIGVPSLDADPADADWTSEIATGSEDSSMAFGKRKMVPNPLAKRIKVSDDLLRMAPNAEQLVRERLGYKFAISEEKGFLTGNGASKPLGIFTASDDGIPTSRDVATGNTSTSITFDGLISAKYALKDQYRAQASWLFHRDAMAQISKLKDKDDQYLWMPSVRDGEPDRILGLPAMTSEYVPNTFTTALYVGMLADFRFYWIADGMNLEIKRLVELYAETNQVGFIGRAFVDGAPVLAEAFARVKLG